MVMFRGTTMKIINLLIIHSWNYDKEALHDDKIVCFIRPYKGSLLF